MIVEIAIVLSPHNSRDTDKTTYRSYYFKVIYIVGEYPKLFIPPVPILLCSDVEILSCLHCLYWTEYSHFITVIGLCIRFSVSWQYSLNCSKSVTTASASIKLHTYLAKV